MPEESHPLVQLAGSDRAPLAGATPAGRLDTSERAELTLVLVPGVSGAGLGQVRSRAPTGRGRPPHRSGGAPLSAPPPRGGAVPAVLGLDPRPQARPHSRTSAAAAPQGHPSPPNQVAGIY